MTVKTWVEVLSILSITINCTPKRNQCYPMTRRLHQCGPTTLLRRRALEFMSSTIAGKGQEASREDKKYTLMGLMGPITLEIRMSLRFLRCPRVFWKVSIKKAPKNSLSSITISLSTQMGSSKMIMIYKIRVSHKLILMGAIKNQEDRLDQWGIR